MKTSCMGSSVQSPGSAFAIPPERRELSKWLPGVDADALDLIISSLTEFNPLMSTDEFIRWLEAMNHKTTFEIKRVPLQALRGWHFDAHLNLRHDSGKFFSVEGIKVSTNHGHVHQWSQPIIYQPEVGILGFLCQKRDGILYFLMQAKIEPGNINKIQLSPTVQATRSNYTQVHGGKKPPFLEHFINLSDKKIIVDQLQSEQGARFLKKRNRNMIIEIPGDWIIDTPENYLWLTLGQIKGLLQHDNIINMDSRTVLSCTQLKSQYISDTIAFSDKLLPGVISDVQREILNSLLGGCKALHNCEEIISWFTQLKTYYDLDVLRCNMDEVDKWQVGEWEISHVGERFFKVIGVETAIGNREVSSWCQPLIQQREPGIIGFILKKINGIYHLLVQAKLEAGNFDTLEMAPTVQCITGSYLKPEWMVPYLDYFLGREDVRIIYDTMQSEEGGRFYREQNRNIVVEVGEDFPISVDPNYIWMTFHQAKEFIKFNNYFNIEARSLIACISVV